MARQFKSKYGITTIEVDGALYNANTIVDAGGSLIGFRDHNDWGLGFRMATFGEAITLLSACSENKNDPYACQILKGCSSGRIVGNTSILWAPTAMFVQDLPEADSLNRDSRPILDESVLESKLGCKSEMGVIFSEDRTIRKIIYGFKTGELCLNEIGQNPGILAVLGSLESVDNLVQFLNRSNQKFSFNGYNKRRDYLIANPELDEIWTSNKPDPLCGLNCEHSTSGGYWLGYGISLTNPRT